MRQLSFSILRNNFSSNKTVKQGDLFREIGWDDLIGNVAFENTCAIRLSLALIKSKVIIPEARMAIKSGPHKGKRIEPGQGKLSFILARESALGKPEEFTTSAFNEGIGTRSGIISFFRLIPGV